MNEREAIQGVLEKVVNLDIDGVTGQVSAALKAGADPRNVLNDGLSAGMRLVGDRFQSGEYFLTELLLAGEVMKAGLVPLEPLLVNTDIQGKGTVVLATVKGDIHDLGKNLVGMMLSAAGFEVIDLGSDVASQRIVEAVGKHQAKIVALSMLLTPMVISLRSAVEEITMAGLRDQVKIIIGGACTTPVLAKELGCDAHGEDAMAAVYLCEKFV
ncbi:MAG: cobalamin-dependent protein [Dehalococcoidia bacterium]|nr:cobalamin-dependent protein [Dehalococcoidia bacterium]